MFSAKREAGSSFASVTDTAPVGIALSVCIGLLAASTFPSPRLAISTWIGVPKELAIPNPLHGIHSHIGDFCSNVRSQVLDEPLRVNPKDCCIVSTLHLSSLAKSKGRPNVRFRLYSC